MQSVGSDYEFGSDLIGHGAFAIVYKGRRKSTDQAVAIKQILLKNIPGKLSSMRQKEISILKDLRHPNIVQLYDCYETKVELYLVMEFCNGGDLGDYLQVKKTLSEDSIRHLSHQIASSLVFIHQHHIIHRDIKPQNVLLTFPLGSTRQFKEASIKIADFGFARYLFEADMAATICGSPIYMAPEILIGHRYDSKADMWSTGVILYQCLTGTTPFKASDPHSLRKQYIRNTLIPRIPPGASSLLSDLLIKLIKKSPQDRMSQEQFQSHSFLQTPVTSPEVLSVHDSPSLHAKSSPLPINRPTATGHNRLPHSSPHSGGLSHGSQKAFSSSSGPPSIHRIITNSSLHKYYSSPPTNVTDEGFILVGTPGAQQIASFGSSSLCSIDGSSSSSYNSSPRGSHHLNLHNLFYSPHNTPMDDIAPLVSGSQQDSTLSNTPPFSSLFKASGQGSMKSVASPLQQSSLQATPSSNYSPDSSPHLKSSTFSSSPGHRMSRPNSRSSSNTKLSTLVESQREETDHVTDHMIDSMNMITPSLLFESDILRNELERLSVNPNSNTSEDNVIGLLKSVPDTEQDERVTTYTKKFSKGLNLSQELADIRRRDMTLSQRRVSLFQLGDSNDSSPTDLEEKEAMFSNEINSPVGSEEMFPLQLEDDGDSPLCNLQQNIHLANELLRIAKTRQGPMLLLSSSMGDSGSMVDHVVRFSEQLVLCTKAAAVVRDGVRQYNITNAVRSCDPRSCDPVDKTVLTEAEMLERLCIEKAKIAKDLYHKCLAKRRRHSLPHISITAEKLIFFQAADMCKQALLEERSARRDDCLKKYHLANMLLKLLQSDAKSHNDRIIIQKYITLIKCRQQLL